MKKFLPILIAPFLWACSTAQLQETGNLVTDVVTDVQAGAVAVQDAYTALSAAQQAMGGHGLSVKNIGTYAQAEASAANTSGLSAAIATVATDISSQIAAGATPAQVTNSITQAQTAVAATSTTSN